MNLYQFLKLNKFQGLSLNLIKRFAVQILQTLALLQKNNVIHCDLKPENILLKQANRSAVKVIDFGSSCFGDRKIYTYIQSRYYRAPEVILGVSYSSFIDIWSFACILVELFTGKPLFPGENETQQLLYIMEYLGLPPGELLTRATRRKVFFDGDNRPKVITDTKGRLKKPASKTFGELLRGTEGFCQLVQDCLVWEPTARITAEQALMNDWLRS
jgi:serine/threonine protein kinase